MSTGTITEAKRTPDEDWSNDNGEFQAWAATIEADGKTYRQKISRKVFKDGGTKGDPTGESVELKDGKWKVVSQQGGGKGNSGGSRYEADPKKQRAIQRESAQKQAVSLFDTLLRHGILEPDKLKNEDGTFKAGTLKPLIEWFDKDISDVVGEVQS